MGEGAPQPHGVTTFCFQQLRKFHINSAIQDKDVINIVAASSRFGLVFVGYEQGIKIIKLDDILNLNLESYDDATEYPCLNMVLPSPPVLLALSSDDMTLAVCVLKDRFCHLEMFDVSHLFLPTAAGPFLSIKLSNSADISLKEMVWNPKTVDMFAVCLTDGSVIVYELNETSFKITGTISPKIKATALSWSPKGKQIVIGKEDGTLSQYKPNLQETKMIPSPNIIENGVSVLNVLWLSTPLFAVVYIARNSDDRTPYLVLVSAQKGENISYISYEDICCGTGDQKFPRYWMYYQQIWGILVCASSNSLETGILGLENDKSTWAQWILEGTARAELPMVKCVETYPMGMAVINCSQKEIIIDEKESYQPMPILFLLSTKGILCPFHMLNKIPGIQSVVTLPEPVPKEGKRKPPELQSFPSSNQNLLTSTPFQANNNVTTVPRFPLNIPKINLSKSFSETLPPKNENETGFIFFSPQNVSAKGTLTKSIASVQQSINTNLPSAFKSGSVVGNSGDTASQPITITVMKPESSPNTNLPAPRTVITTEVKNVTKESIKETSNINKQELTKNSTMSNAKNISSRYLFIVVQNEIVKFEKEVEDLKAKVSGFQVAVGTKEEMKALNTLMNTMEDFSSEIKDSLQSIHTDIHNLKSLVWEAFAMVEEARSQEMKYKDPRYLSLLKSRPLDPISARKFQEIHSLYRYLDSQLQELHRRLDQEWSDFLTANRRKRKALHFPTLETVYHVVQNNHNILPSMNELVDMLTGKIKRLHIDDSYQLGKYLPASYRENEQLSKLEESLQVSFSSPLKESNRSAVKCLSSKKGKMLVNALKSREVSFVKAKVVDDMSQSQLVTMITNASGKKPVSTKFTYKSPEMPKEKSLSSSQSAKLGAGDQHISNLVTQQSVPSSLSSFVPVTVEPTTPSTSIIPVKPQVKLLTISLGVKETPVVKSSTSPSSLPIQKPDIPPPAISASNDVLKPQTSAENKSTTTLTSKEIHTPTPATTASATVAPSIKNLYDMTITPISQSASTVFPSISKLHANASKTSSPVTTSAVTTLTQTTAATT